MIRRRKAVSLFVILAMVFASCAFITGCGDELTPEQKYDAAVKNLNAADDVSLKDGKVTAEMEMSGQKMEITMDIDADYIKDKEDPVNSQMAMNMTLSLLGQSMEMHMYMKDKAVYMDSNGSKTKTSLDDESAEQLKEYIEKSGDSEVSIADYVKESSEEDGVVTLKLDGKKIIKDAMSKLNEEGADNDQIKEIEETIDKIGLDTITAKATIEDENFKDLEYSTTLKLDPELLGTASADSSEKVNLKVKIRFGEIKTNSGLKIDFPDFKDYVESGS